MLRNGIQKKRQEKILWMKNNNVKIRGGNPSSFWIGCGFGFLQKSV